MHARFVILHHVLPDGEHWDLMLERDEALLTWRLVREPVDGSSLPIQAERLGDHRKAYLNYEGPVSGGRGSVRRVDAGTFEFEAEAPEGYGIRLCGRRLIGRFRLAAVDDHWVLTEAER